MGRSATATRSIEQEKLPVRERVARLVDADSFAEEGLLANWEQEGLGADGVVTGLATGRRANGCPDGQRPRCQGGILGPEDRRKDPPDPGVRAQTPDPDGLPRRLGRRPDHRSGADVPGAPGRRADLLQPGAPLGPGAQVCLLFGPERRRRRLHPGLLRHGDHARRQRLDVPRLAADGADGDRRGGHARGDGRGADAHRRLRGAATSSRKTDEEAIDIAQRYLSYMPSNWREARRPPRRPSRLPSGRSPRSSRPTRRRLRRRELIDAVVDGEASSRSKKRWAKELVVGYARLEGRVIGIVANQPKVKGRGAVRRLGRQGGALHLDLQRLQRAAALPRRRPGFMIGTDVERQGIIRHGAKMISAVSEATVPKISVIVRKAYGAGSLRDGRAGVRARLLPRPSDRLDRRDGTGGGDQRRLLQPDPGDL